VGHRGLAPDITRTLGWVWAGASLGFPKKNTRRSARRVEAKEEGSGKGKTHFTIFFLFFFVFCLLVNENFGSRPLRTSGRGHVDSRPASFSRIELGWDEKGAQTAVDPRRRARATYDRTGDAPQLSDLGGPRGITPGVSGSEGEGGGPGAGRGDDIWIIAAHRHPR